ncbi:PAS domain-containing sensor histidine kinase [Arachidicoccus ginsenosidimutans]|uniref:PAS domain-containing sensor histidine kinase n=1 Tax=Arachidicoccus sp. BS20 TaxID=1850526 RepID=UPI0007F1795E|nr:PAS domain-containing sensor histidine kinase [Arachidicoccus sp. BS20]ANI89832.1 PAS domain-containing sensor histidine kinase [Arachidicoccus sp. BS20]
MNKTKNISFDALFRNASMGIVIVDEHGKIVQANPFLLQQFNYQKEEDITGKSIETLIPTRFHHKHTKYVHNYNEHPKSRPMGLGMSLFAMRSDGGEFPVEVSLGNYEEDNINYTIAFVSDISKRKQAEDALKHLNEALEAKIEQRTVSLTNTVNQLAKTENDLREALEKEKELSELKSRFVSMASHEFRTPLSTILSSIYLVSKYTETEDQPKRERHVQRIVSSVNMLTDILNDFLSVGKIEEGKIQVRYTNFDAKHLVENTIGEMKGLLKNGQKIEYVHKGDLGVLLDASLLKHIVMNLLSNAIKFSGEGAAIELSSEKTENQFIFIIKDKGIGISEEDQQHLFSRFFRGANVTNIQGTGLGLHIVSKYAELMNGTITCNSQQEKGTTFTVTFNLSKE